MYALSGNITLSKIKKPGCTLLLFKVLLCLLALPFSKAQSNTIVFQDDPRLKPSDDRDVCYTPECIRTGSRVLSYMNASLDPCDNFYKFACGKFINTNLTRGVDSVDQHSLIRDNVRRQMMNYLRNETLPSSPRYVRLIKTFYNSCIDNSFYIKAKERTLNSLMKVINRTNGWALLKNDSWEDKNFQWENYDCQIESGEMYETFISFSPIYSVGLYSGKTARIIEKPTMFAISDEFKNNLLTFKQLIGVRRSDVEKSLKQMFEVNNKLHEIYIPNNNGNDPMKIMTLNELVQNYPNILWKEFLNTRMKPKIINDDDLLAVYSISYFEKLNKLIPTISKRDLANYNMWRAIDKILTSYLYIPKTKNYRFKICYDILFNKFYEAMPFFYVKNNFKNILFPKDTDELIHNIHKEYSVILKNNSWLDNETKLKALEKLESIIFQSPSQYFSYDEEIDEYYKDLEITPGDYFQSLSKVTEFNNKYESYVNSIQSPGNKKGWKQLPRATFVTAYYRVTQNLVALPPAIFQGVLYNEERPKYMNYGSMGSIIAHEISHAFLSYSTNYDKEGKLVNWWTPKANATLFRKVQCIINKHNHYRDEELRLNIDGYRTQHEDTADYLGTEVAYSAYEKYMETHGPEPLLPGVNFTQRQLFWISYAQSVCAVKTPKIHKYFFETAPHGIPEIRVIGPLSNSLKFADDFHCTSNKKMYPQDKCTIW